MKQNFFSIATWVMRFRYALQGLSIFFKTEHNAWTHLLSTIVVFVLAVIKRVTKTEAIALIFAIGFVWIAELLNTAIEKLADIVTTKYSAEIKIVKDISAAAVFLSAIAALLTGLIIFIPKFLKL